MKLKQKIIYSFLCAGIVPLLFFGMISIYTSKKSLDESYHNAMMQMSLGKKQEVENLFLNMRKQVHVWSENKEFVQAFSEFKEAYDHLENRKVIEQRHELKSYYREGFQKSYLEKNQNQKFDQIEKYVDSLNEQSVYLQYYYMAKNPNEAGKKINYLDAKDPSRWSDVHRKYHHTFAHNVEEFGYYDMFFVDLEGNVIYTAFKEIDFGSNLKKSLLNNSNIAQVYQAAMNTNFKDEESVLLSDFKPYLPSYNAQASFIASPIYQDGDDTKKKIGVLIFQVDVNLIDKLLSNDHKWKDLGFGNTGEVIVFDENYLVRNTLRGLFENKKDFLAKLDKSTLRENWDYMNNLGLSDGVLSLNQEMITAAKESIENKKEVYRTVTDFKGEKVKSLYAPLNVLGHPWGIVAQYDTREMYAEFYNLLLIAGISFIAFAIGIWYFSSKFSHQISTPIVAVANSLIKLKEGKLNSQLSIQSKDEVGDMSKALNETLHDLRSIFNSDEVSWSEVSEQKRREQEAMERAQLEKENAEKALVSAQAAKVQAEAAKSQAESALLAADHEKKEALKAKYVADEEKARAQKAMEQVKEAMIMAEKEKSKSQELAEKEKQNALELQSKVDQILRVVRAAESGDLTQQLNVKGSDAIGQLSEGLRSLFGQFSNDIVHIGKMANLLSKQAELLTTASQNMSRNSSSTLSNAEKMENQSVSVLSGMKNLNNATAEMKQGINEVAKQSTESSQYVSNAVTLVSDVKNLGDKLEESAEDISRFIAVINTIARQTNLLALNATIEAARAGEMGKGFAVVANEVKELARQSGEAADEITEKVGTIKGNTSDIMQSIQNVILLIDNLNKSSKIVAAAAEEQFATSEQFAHLINQSVHEVEQISSGTKEVEVSAKNTNDVVKTTSQLSRELSEAAEKLKAVVTKFKITDSIVSEGQPVKLVS